MSNIQQFFGTLSPPPGISAYDQGLENGSAISGLALLISNLLRVAIFGAGIFALVNLIISGIQYIGSSGNPEYVKQAVSRIWMSLLGLIIIAAVFVLAAIIGLVFFNDPSFLINPIIPNVLST